MVYLIFTKASALVIRKTVPLFCFIFFAAIGSVDASPTLVMQGETASVRFSEAQETAAREVLQLYPAVGADLESVIPWPIDFSPTFVLLKEGELEKIAESHLVTALAVPRRNLVMLDLSKMSRHAFVLESTMKHELCHLLLHHYIHGDLLPKWLDEGTCQWASKGMAEIIMERNVSYLSEAVLAGKLMPLQTLSKNFPGEDRSLTLAYEQSESIVNYICKKHGTQNLLLLLKQLRDGKTVEEAVEGSLSLSLVDLESNWQHSLRKQQTWFLHLSQHLYEILFFVAALLTIAGFIRLVCRRMALRRKIRIGDDKCED